MLQSILTIIVLLPTLVTSKGKFLVIGPSLNSKYAGNWSYENTKIWSHHDHYCGGNLQSPIDLRFNRSQYEPSLQQIYLEKKYSPSK